MRINRNVFQYLLKITVPSFLFVSILGGVCGGVVYLVSKCFSLFTTEHQYNLIIPLFMVMGLVLLGLRTFNDICLIIKRGKKE